MKSSVEFRTSFNSCESSGFKNSRHQIATDFYAVCRHQQHPGSSCDALLLWQGARVELRALQKHKVRILRLLVTHQRGSLMLSCFIQSIYHVFLQPFVKVRYIPTSMHNSKSQIQSWRGGAESGSANGPTELPLSKIGPQQLKICSLTQAMRALTWRFRYGGAYLYLSSSTYFGAVILWHNFTWDHVWYPLVTSYLLLHIL